MHENAINPAELVRIEANALLRLAERMEGPMRGTVDVVIAQLVHVAGEGGRVVAAGLGKSGYIARKMAATLNSLGVPAQFLHAGEASHGDAGMVTERDALLLFSYSGETEEVLRLAEILRGRATGVIAITGCAGSSLARSADHVLDVSIDAEACSMNLAPTASTTVMLALSDAIAVAVSAKRGFRAGDFAELHPGGKLGKRLRKVSELMHAGDSLPHVPVETLLPDVIHEMSAKRLGMTTVVDGDGRLQGVISDGDLRRLLEREGGDALQRMAGDVMTLQASTVREDDFAASAMEVMESKKITAIVVLNGAQRVVGVLHLHDLWDRQAQVESERYLPRK